MLSGKRRLDDSTARGQRPTAFRVLPAAAEMQAAAALNVSLLVGPAAEQPFGFTWGGERSQQLLQRWPSKTSCRPAVGGEAVCTRVWIAPRGLVVKLVVTTFANHPACWWHLAFVGPPRAGGLCGGSSPILENVHPGEFSHGP